MASRVWCDLTTMDGTGTNTEQLITCVCVNIREKARKGEKKERGRGNKVKDDKSPVGQ
jgi:hypothetical protein